MSLIVRNTGSNLPPISEGTHIARCVQVIDLGSQYSEVYDKWSPKVMIRWEVDETFTDADGNEQPRLLGSTYTQSLSENAALRKMLEGWRGKKFSEEELQGFNLAVLVGLPCMITVTHSTNNGKTYANPASVAAMPKNLEAPEQVTPGLVVDLDAPDAADKVNSLPDFIRNIIAKSQEWQPAPVAETELVPGYPNDDLPF